METKTLSIEPLLERAEEYGRTGFKLIKLKALDKAADISSTFLSRTLFLIVLLFFVLTLNIGIALWIGDLLEKNYAGFLIVAAFYCLVAIVLLFLHKPIKTRISDSIIKIILS